MSRPYTVDPILQTYRFCNLRRRDDRVSQWLINNILQFRHIGFSEWSFIQFVALCRWINWPPTLIAMRDARLWPRREFDLEEIGDFLDTLQRKKVWTGAYMIRAPDGPYKDMGKGFFVSTVVVGEGLDSVRKGLLAAIANRSLEGTWRALANARYWGSFMAGQVAVDFTYTTLLDDARDLTTWAAQGPGSVRGFNRLLGRPLSTPIGEGEWLERLQGWREDIIRMLGEGYKDLPLMDVQNCLCEVDKYLRVQSGEGRPRSFYKPETEY